MPSFKKSFAAAAILAVGIATGSSAALAIQGHMLAARSDLQAARFQLNSALRDKDGHRTQALTLVDQAIQQVNQGLAAGAR